MTQTTNIHANRTPAKTGYSAFFSIPLVTLIAYFLIKYTGISFANPKLITTVCLIISMTLIVVSKIVLIALKNSTRDDKFPDKKESKLSLFVTILAYVLVMTGTITSAIWLNIITLLFIIWCIIIVISSAIAYSILFLVLAKVTKSQK